MRGASLIVGTLITLTILGAAQAAMVADLRAVTNREAERESAAHQWLDPVWDGGVLPPVVVEVTPSKAPPATARMVPRQRAPSTTPRGVAARIT